MWLKTVNTDYHIHSEFSYCSEDITIAKVAELVSQKGLKSFFITDHSSHLYFDAESSWRFGYLKNSELFEKAKYKSNKIEEYISRINRFSSQGARVGLEVDCVFDGDLIFDSSYRDKVELLIGSIHHLPCLWGKPGLEELTREFLYYTNLLLEKDLVLPAYDFVMKASHSFNLLDARGAISVKERTAYIGRVRNLARQTAKKYIAFRESLGFPLLKTEKANTNPV